MKATWPALAIFLVILLTLMGRPGRVEAQPADAKLVQKLEQAQAEAQRARAEAESLKAQLEQALDQARANAVREAIAQRDAAQFAEAKARQLAKQGLAAREAAESEKKRAQQAQYAAQLQAAQQAFAREKETARGAPAGLGGDLSRARAELLTNFEQKRAELSAQLKHLDEEQQRMLAAIEKKAQILRERTQGEMAPGAGPVGHGTLDQILEKLQSIERRLDRLERQK